MSFIGYKYITFINYKTLSLWDVKRYMQDHISFGNAVKLKDVLSPFCEPVTKKEMIINNWQIVSKISFSGDLFLRNISETISFKGNLNKVEGDSLIYSKINVRHGCIYYHPHDAIPFGVSSEYPVYKIDSTRVLGDFLVMVIQSNAFKTILNRKATGISKARVKPTEFLEIEIPIPELSVQEKLLNTYNGKIHQARTMEAEACQIEKCIDEYLIQTLGIVTQLPPKKQGNYTHYYQKQNREYNYLRFVRFTNVVEWGIDIVSKKQKGESYKFPIIKIKDLCQIGSGGTPSRSCSHYYKGTTPWIKTGEVVNEEIFDTEEHITEEAIANSSAKLYPKGSLIIAMYGQGDTRGRTAKLGVDATTNQACAVLHHIDNNIVTTDYLWYYLQGRYHDLRSMASGNNQPNLNAGKIRNYDVVVPPMDIQNEIVAYIKKQKVLAKQLKRRAQVMRKEALKEFEKEIIE
ncbi:MAG: restriction endonuclease subunit S [Bacteroidaceae bacterium]|nr:restriction endonuclease subunit S [Bacteroidaceae bacterium]